MGMVLGSVVVGAILQRTSGLGFAMVVAPFVVLALGPAQGVVLVQLCGATAAALVFARVRQDVDWLAYRRLMPASVLGIVVGAAAVSRVPDAPAQVITATVLLLALVAATAVGKVRTVERTAGITAGAGVGAGLMTSLAGVGGTAMTVLSQATRWEQRSFAATLQPYFVSISGATVLARVVADPTAWPALTGAAWLAIAAAVGLGLLAGEWVSRYIPSSAARWATLVIAAIGAIMTLVDGLTRW